MESALSTTPFSISKTLHLHLPTVASLSCPSPLRFGTSSSAASLPSRFHRRFKFLESSAAGSGGRAFGGGGGGDSKVKVGVGAADDLSALSSDAIILNVGGMSCGGCVSSVKKILESQPQVSSASVDLTTETAIVCLVSEANALPNWQKELGEALAKHLTSCGFQSNLRVAGEEAIEGGVSP
ncbi:hypothetical protein V6N13_101278 [Hibiscus sabdariffa]|uniref:HMA domain-containing protein n=1 Tax=Hibiscus sabdariffa TaxID=183260 RepID=A0ABR2QKZ2_9ROSI